MIDPVLSIRFLLSLITSIFCSSLLRLKWSIASLKLWVACPVVFSLLKPTILAELLEWLCLSRFSVFVTSSVPRYRCGGPCTTLLACLQLPSCINFLGSWGAWLLRGILLLYSLLYLACVVLPPWLSSMLTDGNPVRFTATSIVLLDFCPALKRSFEVQKLICLVLRPWTIFGHTVHNAVSCYLSYYVLFSAWK